MSKIRDIADSKYVKTQYQSASNLRTRIRLHELFSTNKYGWQRWMFDQLHFRTGFRVLELGCGAGVLWAENMDRLPSGGEIVLSDISNGMLEQAKEYLKDRRELFQFEVIDAQNIPYDDNSFDIVIANHMLYHIPDRTKALAEIQRILKPEGCFYAATIGSNHLRELRQLLSTFDPELALWGKLPSNSFALEEGTAQLQEYFANVSTRRYPDSLVVTEVGPLVDYILSGRIELSAGRQNELVDFVKAEFENTNGRFVIAKDSGIFIALNDSQF